jgi:hypothetical protein
MSGSGEVRETHPRPPREAISRVRCRRARFLRAIAAPRAAHGTAGAVCETRCDVCLPVVETETQKQSVLLTVRLRLSLSAGECTRREKERRASGHASPRAHPSGPSRCTPFIPHAPPCVHIHYGTPGRLLLTAHLALLWSAAYLSIPHLPSGLFRSLVSRAAPETTILPYSFSRRPPSHQGPRHLQLSRPWRHSNLAGRAASLIPAEARVLRPSRGHRHVFV